MRFSRTVQARTLAESFASPSGVHTARLRSQRAHALTGMDQTPYSLCARNAVINGVTADGTPVSFKSENRFSDVKAANGEYVQTWVEYLPDEVVKGTAPAGTASQRCRRRSDGYPGLHGESGPIPAIRSRRARCEWRRLRRASKALLRWWRASRRKRGRRWRSVATGYNRSTGEGGTDRSPLVWLHENHKLAGLGRVGRIFRKGD